MTTSRVQGLGSDFRLNTLLSCPVSPAGLHLLTACSVFITALPAVSTPWMSTRSKPDHKDRTQHMSATGAYMQLMPLDRVCKPPPGARPHGCT